MNYREYKQAKQKSFNELPIFFAFGEKQFKEQMEKRGLTENDTDKIYGLHGTGGYYLRSDADVVRAWFNSKDELMDLMKDSVFAEDAFLYEMRNHEYEYNWQGDWDVCNCFGNCDYVEGRSGEDYLRDIGYGSETIRAYVRAKDRYFGEGR